MSNKYVATNGNDETGDGSLFNPWKTINYGYSQLALGNTLYCRGGTYNEYITIANGGENESQRKTISNYASESVKIDFTGLSGEDHAVEFDYGGVDYITLYGLEFQNSDHEVGLWTVGDWIILDHCIFHGLAGAFTHRNGDYLTVRYCESYGNGNEYHQSNGLTVEDANHVLIEHNYVHDNDTHFGINVYAHPYGWTFNLDDIVVRYNICHGNVGGHYYRYIVNSYIYDNIVYDSLQDGIYFHRTQGAEHWDSNSVIYHNTVYGSLLTGLYLNGAGNMTWENNIFSQNFQTALEEPPGSTYYREISILTDEEGHSSDGNVYDPIAENTSKYLIHWGSSGRWNLATCQANGFETHGRVSSTPITDLDFDNVGSKDFHIGTDSIAKEIENDTGISDDYDGVARPQGTYPDAGAYEYKGGLEIALTFGD